MPPILFLTRKTLQERHSRKCPLGRPLWNFSSRTALKFHNGLPSGHSPIHKFPSILGGSLGFINIVRTSQKSRLFGTFTDWMFQKVALHVQVQKVWDVKCSETSNIQVKCSSRKLWLTHEDEKPIRLSPIMSWDLWQGNLIIRLTVFWESSNIFSNPVLKCTKRWLPNLQGVLDVLKHWNFTVCKWCITRYPLPMPNSTSLLR